MCHENTKVQFCYLPCSSSCNVCFDLGFCYVLFFVCFFCCWGDQERLLQEKLHPSAERPSVGPGVSPSQGERLDIHLQLRTAEVDMVYDEWPVVQRLDLPPPTGPGVCLWGSKSLFPFAKTFWRNLANSLGHIWLWLSHAVHPMLCTLVVLIFVKKNGSLGLGVWLGFPENLRLRWASWKSSVLAIQCRLRNPAVAVGSGSGISAYLLSKGRDK